MPVSNFSQQDYEIVKKELLFQGFFRVMRYHIRHRLFNGGWSETFSREIMERFPAAAVLPYDPKLDRVILIEQFRPGCIGHSASPWLIEIPAGLITEKNTAPETIANNEANEEAGCDITSLEKICDYFVSPGAENEYMHLYCGKTNAEDIQGIHGLAHEHEDIRVLNVSRLEAFDLLQQGKIKTSPAMLALMWLQLNCDRLKHIW